LAHIYVKNSLSNLKAAKVNINLPAYVSTDSEGDPIWLLEVATTYPSVSGTKIRPVYINKATPFEELDAAVASAVSKIASQINWLPLAKDDSPPYVTEAKPMGSAVSIASNIEIDIREDAPSAGIDLSEVEIVLNTGAVDLDITNECVIAGTPFEFNIHWEPPVRLTQHYDEE